MSPLRWPGSRRAGPAHDRRPPGARQVGASRQSVYAWVARCDEGGLEALSDRSRRPHYSPTQVSGEMEATVCELRLAHPRWCATWWRSTDSGDSFSKETTPPGSASTRTS
ncbi:helix-turn-helix domain-containing protein [Streptomyces monticola]|uniref:Helix-turn-helix domain-containing protein n=1 Tax=Streptomyces monticola TaxID=2666263 RepID=A0ABW2JN05_9ACTN